ncbi:tetratricopeptide repeat protein [Eionea flava]
MNIFSSVKRAYCITLIVSAGLAGCKSLPSKPQALPDPLTPSTNSTALPAKTPHASAAKTARLPTDTLYSLLVAEVAASRQQYDITVDNYTAQAKTTDALPIIKRAARITQFLRTHESSLDMGLLWLEQEPNNSEALATVANAYIELQQPLKAIDHIERLMAQKAQATNNIERVSTPNIDGSALIETLANRNRQADKNTIDTLVSRLLPLANNYPNAAGVHVGIGSLYQAMNNSALAREWIDKALAIDNTRTSTILQDIRLLQLSHQNEAALKKLKTYVEQSPDNHRLRLVYARLLSQSDLTGAYQQFTILAEQSPNQLDIRFSRALLATELEKMTVAKPLFESLLNVNYQPDNVNFYLGHIADFQEQTDTALAYYLAVKQGDHFLSAQYRAASVYLEQNNIKRAQHLYTTLHAQHPDKTEQLYENEASLLVKYNADIPAMALLNKAIAAFPDNSNLRYDRATLYERKDQIALMEQDFRHVLEKDPDNVAALNGLGYLLTIRTSRYDEAYALIKKALSLNSNDAAIIDSMGWVLFKMGRTKEAISYLQKAYKQYPNPEVAAHLGEALWANNEQDAAKAIWQESLEQNPDAQDIPDTLKRLGITW